MTNKKTFLFLLLIIVAGLSLRLINLQRYILWQDESETVINSLQVLEDGYPHGYFKGRLIFENNSFIEIDDPVYKFASTNYYGSKYENNKGWLTYFYLAPFLKIFGVSEASARLPFIALFIPTIILLYLFTKELFRNKKIALLATAIFAIDYFAIYYGQQARYYSLFILLTLWSLYLNYLYIKYQKNKYLFWLSTSLILMFHTHIVLFLFLGMFFIYYDIIKTKKIRLSKNIIYNLIYILIFTTPWLILVKFWVNFDTHDVNNNKESAKILWLLIIILIPITIKLGKVLLARKKPLGLSKKFHPYLFSFFVLYIFLVPLIIPAESLTARVFGPLIPVFAIFFSIVIWNIAKHPLRRKYYVILLMAGIIIYVPLFKVFKANGYGTANGIVDILQYAQETNLSKDDLLTVNWQDFPLSLNSDYNVYITQTLNPDFFNNYPGRIITFFMYDHLYYDSSADYKIFLQKHEFWLNEDKFQDYRPRLEKCEQGNLDNHVLFFDCPAIK